MSSPALAELDKPLLHTVFETPADNIPPIDVTVDPTLEIKGFASHDLAIDQMFARTPEDALSGAQSDCNDGLAARRTMVDPTLNEKYEIDLRDALNLMNAGEFRASIALIARFERVHYRRKGQVRSLVTPFCSSRRGQVMSPGPKIVNVGTKIHRAGEIALHKDKNYQAAEEAVHRIAQIDDIEPGQSKSLDFGAREARALSTVRLAAMATNTVLTSWAADRQIPQIVKSKPEEVHSGHHTAMMSRYISSTELSPSELQNFPASHTAIGKRDQRIAGYVNLIQIITALRTDKEPIFGPDDIRFFAEALTMLKAQRRA